MIIGTRNWLPDLTPGSQVTTPTTATGYEVTHLWRGGTAQAWRSASSSDTHVFEFRLGAGRPVDLAAVFDLRASGAASVVSVELGRKTVWGFGVVTDVGDIDLSERGDGALKLAVPVVSETWVVTVTLSASALLYVGKIWLGLAAVTSKAPVRLRETRQGNAIVNVSDARTSRSARLASVTRSLDLAWSSISAAQRAELLAVFEALAGSGSRCVLVPDEQDMTAAYLGRISDSVSSEIDPARWWQGHGFGFTEEGRALGG